MTRQDTTAIRFWRYYCTRAHGRKGSKYSNTLLLPKSPFKAFVKSSERVALDRELAKACGLGQDLYDWQFNRPADMVPRGDYILHDGPPYANGDVHVGHAINKIMKDIICRFRAMAGWRVTFRPGWDCHGLPIELKALEATASSSSHVPSTFGNEPIFIRQLAREFASKYIEVQKSAFLRWGVSANWKNPYYTFDAVYEARQLDAFWKLYSFGLIHRAYKPVYWSPSSRTALAQAELTYDEHHVSPSVYVKFPLFLPDDQLSDNHDRFVLIWTTTPWTLPLNDAIAFNPTIDYCWLEVPPLATGSKTNRELWLVAENLVPALSEQFDWPLSVRERITGDLIGLSTYFHPMNDELSASKKFVPASFVNTKSGTGLVHISYGHGFEDYKVAEQLGIGVDCHVDELGSYASDLKYHRLAGKSVLSTETTDEILNAFCDHIVCRKDYVHDYPYDWRTNQPVIVRPSLQWFIDTSSIKEAAANFVANKEVEFLPSSGSSVMVAQLSSRPSWCISRQRVWGTPIPAFYRLDNGQPIMSKSLVDHLGNLFKTHPDGSDSWWSLSDDELFPERLREEIGLDRNCAVRKGQDIMDIWLDSGLSWYCVHDGQSDVPSADLIVEGHDQFRGWFSSLLLTAAGLAGSPPYRKALVHGFALDGSGRKMSKSEGNVIAPNEITDVHQQVTPSDGSKPLSTVLGADGLRFWVASYAGTKRSIYLSSTEMSAIFKRIKEIRLILKFIFGTVADFDQSILENFQQPTELNYIDAWVLHELANYMDQMYALYDACEIDSAMNEVHEHFIDRVLSSVYINTIKDRLYCDPVDSKSRRSAQFALSVIGRSYVASLSPVFPHLTEETAGYWKGLNPGDIFRQGWPTIPNAWRNERPVFKTAVQVRNRFAAEFGLTTNYVKKQLTILASPHIYEELFQVNGDSAKNSNSELCSLFKVATVNLVERDDLEFWLWNKTGFELVMSGSTNGFCERCRRYCICGSLDHDLCARCQNVLSGLNRDSNQVARSLS